MSQNYRVNGCPDLLAKAHSKGTARALLSLIINTARGITQS